MEDMEDAPNMSAACLPQRSCFSFGGRTHDEYPTAMPGRSIKTVSPAYSSAPPASVAHRQASYDVMARTQVRCGKGSFLLLMNSAILVGEKTFVVQKEQKISLRRVGGVPLAAD